MYFERKVSGKIRKVLLILEKLLVKTGKMLFFSRFDQFIPFPPLIYPYFYRQKLKISTTGLAFHHAQINIVGDLFPCISRNGG